METPAIVLHRDYSTRHALVMLTALLVVPVFSAVSRWPWALLAPLSLYALVILAVPSLRRSAHWLRIGKRDRQTLLWAGLISLVSILAMLVWHSLTKPDLSVFAALVPKTSPVALVGIGLLFAAVNATGEEVIVRGILMEALRARYDTKWTVIWQALIFGLMHAQGIPQGVPGISMATLYGGMLGLLRSKANGLLACILAHFVADSTIFALVVWGGPYGGA